MERGTQVKGATLTALHVTPQGDGWEAAASSIFEISMDIAKLHSNRSVT